jgi:hypothetical protein
MRVPNFRAKTWRAGAWLFWSAGLAGCAPAFPRHLLTIEAKGCDFPVMLSDTQPREHGRKLEATSGTLESVAGQLHTWGHSEIGASAKLAAQVKRSDKWVQIERVEYTAADELDWLIAATETRHITVHATAQP